MNNQVFYRDRNTWLAYIALAFYGYFLNSFGAITPFLKEEFDLSYTTSSLHFTAFAFSILIIGFWGQNLIYQIGQWNSLWIGIFGISISVYVLLAGNSPAITISASFFMGLIGSLNLIIVPIMLTEQHRKYHVVAISEANFFTSLVASAAPLIVGWSAQVFNSWRLALGSVALIPILILLVFGKQTTTLPPTNKKEQTTKEKKALPFLYWVFWISIVLAVSAEFCMIFWSAIYLETNLGMLKVDAAQAISLFLTAMIIGRFIGSRLVHYFSTHRVITISVLLAISGFLVFWLAGNVMSSLIGLFITGLGVASFYPLFLSLAIGVSNNAIHARFC